MVAKTRERTPKSQVELTQTDLPPGVEGRHRTVFRGHEVAHYWSSNRQSEGKAGNIFFRWGTIFSYGQHFPMARHVLNKKTKRKFILFTTRGYSNSTAKHLSYVRRAIPADAIVFRVPNVDADTRGEHLKNLDAYRGTAIDDIGKSQRARTSKSWYLQQAIEGIEEGNRYAEAVGLTERLGSPKGGDLRSWLQSAAAKIEAAEAKERALESKRLRAKVKVWEEKTLPEWQAKLAKWQAGESPEVERRPASPDRNMWLGEDRLCYVRISRGKFLQTTLGMTVPLKDVLPVLEAIRKGDPVNPVGGFSIQDWSGQIHWINKEFHIGCHIISFDEIERAAKAAGL